jgi:hypothetical protein
MLNKTLSQNVFLVEILNKYRMEQSQRGSSWMTEWLSEILSWNSIK